MNEDLSFRALRALQANPQLSQRQLSQTLGISLSKTNYCLRALIARGLVKAENFRGSHNRRAYAYLLTPDGIEQKTRLIARFLKRKQAEYEALKAEIAELTADVEASRAPREPTPAQGITSRTADDSGRTKHI